MSSINIEEEKMMLESLFLNSEKFYIEVDNLVKKHNIPYMQAVMDVCDMKDINPEDLISNDLISPLLKMKLYDEAMLVGLLKPESRLPI